MIKLVLRSILAVIIVFVLQHVENEALNLSSNRTRQNRGRYATFRSMEHVVGGGTRRLFGGRSAALEEWPAVCALLDRYWSARCSAAALTPHWVLTAAHCVSPRLAYVKYNTRRPASNEGDVTPVHYLYRHPKFEVKQEDEGRGPDVTVLHHDVGLVRTRNKMNLDAVADLKMINNLRIHSGFDLQDKNVKVLGFGRTERSVLGEELFSVELHLVPCEREGWYHCVCGMTLTGDARGVCSGDSGGPVLYNGVQVGVTSMGPVECARAGDVPPHGASSVFTMLYQYADVVNATISDTETALRMRMISRASPHHASTAPLLHLLSWCAVRYVCDTHTSIPTMFK
ncbi:chymotrypsin-1-like [Leptidea sinapis]|uniref:chymotrypsin-1-like n=1 Tax=Leptidea sinapis TaxID=189913 RepID=UPI002133AC9F|nr:chymotrypsin-1-like [Leptidea sinapis]